MGTSSIELAKRLRKCAARQFGCFTAAQAIDAGYAYSVHLYHVKTGKWVRLARGIYRLASFPDTPEARLMAVQLWPRNKAGAVPCHFAGPTAAAIRAGRPADAIPPYSLCVPAKFRSATAPPQEVEILRKPAPGTTVSKIGPFSVETPANAGRTAPVRAKQPAAAKEIHAMTKQDASIFFYPEQPRRNSSRKASDLVAEARSIAETEAWGTWGVRPWKRTGETGAVDASVAFGPTAFAAPVPASARGKLDIPDWYDAIDAEAALRDVAEYRANYC